jgi:hypothetical protein
LDEAFLYERTIDIERYDRHRNKLREELTIAQMDRHASELEEVDVEGILAFAERVLPSASKLWVQSSLNQKQRLQQLFFPEGVRVDGKRLVGTGVTLSVFNYLSPVSESKKEVVDQTGIEPVTSYRRPLGTRMSPHMETPRSPMRAPDVDGRAQRLGGQASLGIVPSSEMSRTAPHIEFQLKIWVRMGTTSAPRRRRQKPRPTRWGNRCNRFCDPLELAAEIARLLPARVQPSLDRGCARVVRLRLRGVLTPTPTPCLTRVSPSGPIRSSWAESRKNPSRLRTRW